MILDIDCNYIINEDLYDKLKEEIAKLKFIIVRFKEVQIIQKKSNRK